MIIFLSLWCKGDFSNISLYHLNVSAFETKIIDNQKTYVPILERRTVVL